MRQKQPYWAQQKFRDWMLKTQKIQKHHKYHCARLCDIFDSRFFSTLTELAGVTNNKLSERIINEHNNEAFSEKDSIKNV